MPLLATLQASMPTVGRCPSTLDPGLAAGAAEAALGALIAGGALDPVELANEAAAGGGGLRAVNPNLGGGGSELLTPQDALLW
jgi:hypothetical protein